MPSMRIRASETLKGDRRVLDWRGEPLLASQPRSLVMAFKSLSYLRNPGVILMDLHRAWC